MNKEEVFDTYKECIMPTYTKTPLVFVKAKGSRLWDIHNDSYLDFFPGWGVCNLGHCHPKVMSAVRDQISKLIFIPNNYFTIPQAKLAKELNFLAKHPCKVFFCNSGAEANEAAIKFSRKFGGGRFEIITFKDSFHGRTLGALAATGQPKYQAGFAPLPEGFKTVAYNDLSAVKSALTDKTIAIMLELIQGEGGINIADKDFVRGLRKLCDAEKLLLIVDEVQTGIGRTGTMFAYQQYGVTPDVVTLAKALGGGLPIGVMMVKKSIADCMTAGTHASTFGGGAVICKAALAVLTALQKEKLLNNTMKMGAYLQQRLLELKNKYPVIKDVRGIGLMWGVELTREAQRAVEGCLKKKLLINCTHDTVLRLMPALNVTKKEIDKAVYILDSVLGALN
ncbi:MAG: aspartate aminotransferase family protein [Candidatus Omnitrophota bacterium]|jgi:acetylornithine/N-succinyldiaminopimelate aminotransferase